MTTIKKEIYKLIRNDTKLRRKIANELEVTDASVYGHAVREAPKLKEYPVVKIIMEHTGYSEDQIFDPKVKGKLQSS